MSKSVLFICTGNVCRSPMAEGLFRQLVEEAGLSDTIKVSSAGVGAMEGQPPSRNSIKVTAELDKGIDISEQRSQMVTPALIKESTHIFGMARSHVEVIRHSLPDTIEKTFVVREFVTEDEGDLDVFDPIGGDEDEYRDSRNLILETLEPILKFVSTGELAP